MFSHLARRVLLIPACFYCFIQQHHPLKNQDHAGPHYAKRHTTTSQSFQERQGLRRRSDTHTREQTPEVHSHVAGARSAIAAWTWHPAASASSTTHRHQRHHALGPISTRFPQCARRSWQRTYAPQDEADRQARGQGLLGANGVRDKEGRLCNRRNETSRHHSYWRQPTMHTRARRTASRVAARQNSAASNCEGRASTKPTRLVGMEPACTTPSEEAAAREARTGDMAGNGRRRRMKRAAKRRGATNEGAGMPVRAENASESRMVNTTPGREEPSKAVRLPVRINCPV